MTGCNFIETVYKRYVMDDLKKFSNLPQYAAGEGACPVKTVRFRYLKKKLKNVRSNI